MYLATTRPDLSFSISVISRFMEKPTEKHLVAAKRVLRYVKGTLEFGIMYRRSQDVKLMVFSDSDYAGDHDDRKSTLGKVIILGSGAVSWTSKKQPIVTLSTTEAEYVAAASCACQGIWLNRILKTLGENQLKCITIQCDNNSSIKLSKNPVLHGRSKHIDVRFHFLRDLCRDGEIELIYCPTHDQVADMMTKAVTFETFSRLRTQLGMCTISEVN